MREFNAILIIICLASLVFMAMMWTDYRRAWQTERARACVSEDQLSQLLDTCESLSQSNNGYRAELLTVHSRLEEIRDQEKERRRQGHDKIWRASRNTRSKKDSGRGGPR